MHANVRVPENLYHALPIESNLNLNLSSFFQYTYNMYIYIHTASSLYLIWPIATSRSIYIYVIIYVLISIYLSIYWSTHPSTSFFHSWWFWFHHGPAYWETRKPSPVRSRLAPQPKSQASVARPRPASGTLVKITTQTRTQLWNITKLFIGKLT